MSITTILTRLTEKKLLTETEITILKQKTSSKDFLEALIKIYEDKAKLYLSSCQRGVKRTLQSKTSSADELEILTLQETMQFAYSAFLETNKVSVLSSLMLLLKKIDADLAISLGIAAAYKQNYKIKEEAQKVFIHYVARARLFSVLDTTDLKELCEAVNNETPELFPAYLFNVFLIEKKFSEAAKILLIDQIVDQIPGILAQQIQSGIELMTNCVQGLVYYLSTLLDYSQINSAYRDTFFYHLRDNNSKVAFASTITTGYLSEICKEQRQKDLMTDNAAILNSDLKKICFPALSLLDYQVTDNFEDIRSASDAATDKLNKIRNAKEETNRIIDAAKADANAKIDKWRADVKLPGITIGVQIGISGSSGSLGIPFNLK